MGTVSVHKQLLADSLTPAHLFCCFTSLGDAPGMGDNKGTRRGPGGGKPVRKEKKSYNGDKPKKTSLRIGTGKRGRGAELSMRRSSLKKRDRTKEKERKEEAALERRTVSLPE